MEGVGLTIRYAAKSIIVFSLHAAEELTFTGNEEILIIRYGKP